MPYLPKSSRHPRLEAHRQLVVELRQVEDGGQVLAQHVGQARDDDVAEVVLDALGRIGAARADDGVDEDLGVGDPHRELAEGAQAHHGELLVAEDHRLLGAPLEVEEGLGRDEDHRRLERRGAAERDAEQAGVSTGTFWVASVWRPGPKVSSALPSRKNTACWLSSTMSWLPRRIAAGAVGRPARHHRLPGRVVVLDHVHRVVSCGVPGCRAAEGSGQAGAPTAPRCRSPACAAATCRRARATRSRTAVEAPRARIVGAGRRHGRDRLLELRQVVHAPRGRTRRGARAPARRSSPGRTARWRRSR